MRSIYNNTKLNNDVIIELSSRIWFIDRPEDLINHFPLQASDCTWPLTPGSVCGSLQLSDWHLVSSLTDYFCVTHGIGGRKISVISGNASIGHLSHLWIGKHGARAAGSSCVSHLHAFTACICFSFTTFLCPGLMIFPVINHNKQIIQCVLVCVCTYTHCQVRFSAGNRLCGCSLSCTVIFLPKILLLLFFIFLF